MPGIAPTISLNSTTVAVSAGNDISLVVTTSPLEPLLFQWFFNGVPLEGASGTMLRLRSAQRFHSGDYSVLITRADTSTLAEPVLANDDWSSNANAAEIAGATATLGAFELDPASADAVLLAELEPGPYTIVADGADAITGVVLVELYDADHLSPGSENSPQADEPSPGGLVNLSARAFVGAGAELPIPGFVVSEEGPLTLLIRAAGPALAGFGVASTLPDTQLTIFGGEIALFGNDDWGTGPYAADTAAIAAQVGAFELPAGSKDAAMVVTLAPGAYTVVVSNVTGATGVALVEVYLVR
ncbi:MAG TPA: immunoglobulin domain-containing protein [Opitutaceae bacterium]